MRCFSVKGPLKHQCPLWTAVGSVHSPRHGGSGGNIATYGETVSTHPAAYNPHSTGVCSLTGRTAHAESGLTHVVPAIHMRPLSEHACRLRRSRIHGNRCEYLYESIGASMPQPPSCMDAGLQNSVSPAWESTQTRLSDTRSSMTANALARSQLRLSCSIDAVTNPMTCMTSSTVD